jgi:hypothetical protein
MARRLRSIKDEEQMIALAQRPYLGYGKYGGADVGNVRADQHSRSAALYLPDDPAADLVCCEKPSASVGFKNIKGYHTLGGKRRNGAKHGVVLNVADQNVISAV